VIRRNDINRVIPYSFPESFHVITFPEWWIHLPLCPKSFVILLREEEVMRSDFACYGESIRLCVANQIEREACRDMGNVESGAVLFCECDAFVHCCHF